VGRRFGATGNSNRETQKQIDKELKDLRRNKYGNNKINR
jgi:hypothetical protein